MSTNSTPSIFLGPWLLIASIIAHGALAHSLVEDQCCSFSSATHRTEASTNQEQPASGRYMEPPLRLVGYIGSDKARDIIWRATGWTVVSVTHHGSYYSVTAQAPDGSLYQFRVDARTGKID